MNVSVYMLCHSIVIGLFAIGFVSAMTMSAVTCRTQEARAAKEYVMLGFMFSAVVAFMFVIADVWLITQQV